MVELEEIPFDMLAHYVWIAFENDKELIDKYHIVNGDLAKSVEHTLEIIKKTEEQYFLKYYVILSDKNPIGFTVIGNKYLLSFGIGILYRTKEIVIAWWNLIKEMLNNEFCCFLWTKNKRAIDFLVKNGMEVEQSTDLVTSLIFI